MELLRIENDGIEGVCPLLEASKELQPLQSQRDWKGYASSKAGNRSKARDTHGAVTVARVNAF
jgi:hypothetical protein